MTQKFAPAEKNSTDISAASATFCISAHVGNNAHGSLSAGNYLECTIVHQGDEHGNDDGDGDGDEHGNDDLRPNIGIAKSKYCNRP